MAKRKKANVQPWDAVFDRVQILLTPKQRRLPGYVYPAPITDATLNEVESQLDCRLPESYRAFMKRFGPGEVADRVRLTPLGVGSDGDHSLLGQTRGMRELFLYRMAERPHPNAAWLGRLVYFGSDFCGDSYAWDTEDVTNSDAHECRVYQLQRHNEGNPEVVGTTLADLIQWAQAQAFEDDVPSPGIEFSPWGVVREKVKPGRTDVTLWLAWNNHAARDLALAIRDHGRTDAFPILADALQEAGCTNADLLDSCRTGDPDIDGVWVLRVLLGEPERC